MLLTKVYKPDHIEEITSATLNTSIEATTRIKGNMPMSREAEFGFSRSRASSSLTVIRIIKQMKASIPYSDIPGVVVMLIAEVVPLTGAIIMFTFMYFLYGLIKGTDGCHYVCCN